MKITRENYEPFFLDYLENNLKEDLIDQFLDFLEQNPDLKEELQLFNHFNLSEEKIIFSGKNQLYKSVADEKAALENRFIACLEGDLEDSERHLFEDYLANRPELKNELKLFAKTRLIPDPAISFPEKYKLKRKSGSVVLLNWVARIAAVVLLLWGINAVIRPVTPPEIPQTAEVISKPILQVEKAEDKKSISETSEDQNLTAKIKPQPGTEQIVESVAVESPVENQTIDFKSSEHNTDALAEISPRMARLESPQNTNQLLMNSAMQAAKYDKTENVLSIEEFLASQAKKVGDKGLLSAKRLARAGLDVASGISGERIGYIEKNGQIASIEFESKLFAFSIPLKKE
jgi:hypothetical protein